MIRGLYVAASAARAHEARLATLVNNAANMQTAGYKQDRSFDGTSGFYQMVLSRLGGPAADSGAPRQVGMLSTGTGANLASVDLTPGPLAETGRNLDLALNGPGLLVVQTPGGSRYTRAGSLRTDSTGLLTQPDGSPVLGADGPIRLKPGFVQVDESGGIFVDGKPAGRLRLVEIAPEALKRAGNTYFEAQDPGAVKAAGQTAVSQGFLESSNVDLTRNTVALMQVARSYGAAQECIRLADEMLGRAVSDLGRLGA